MKKRLLGDRLGSPIDKYALMITLFVVGVFLLWKSDFVISTEITKIVSNGCLCLSSIMLMKVGRNLEKRNIEGVPEMALGAFQGYLIASGLPNDGYWSILYLFSVAFYFFTFIGGFLAFLCSWFRHSKNKETDLLSKIESIVAIITALVGCVLAGIQLIVQ